MLLYKINSVSRLFLLKNGPLTSCNYFHTTSQLSAGSQWRKKNNLYPNGKEDGRLIDEPDWTYIDGRPPILNPGRRRRFLVQNEICRKIIAVSKEVDFIVEDHAKAMDELKKERERILNSKLKAKGDLLLAKEA